MKILQLIDNLHLGGAERMCVNIANVMHDYGYDVQICVSREAGLLSKFISTGIKCHMLNKKKTLDMVAFYHFIKILRTEKIDIIHAHSTSIFWAVLAKTFRWKMKVIWHDHLGLNVNERYKKSLYRYLSPSINVIIVVNQGLVEWSRRNMKVPQSRIVLINNFPLLREVPRSPDPMFFTIVCLANFRPQKDHETLIRAIGQLNSNKIAKTIKLILAGAFTEDVYYLSIQNLIDELNLKGIIEITGPVEDTAALLSKADCGVLSSISEGLPVSLLEYGLAGLPVVVTNVGQCSEVLVNGMFGKIVPPSNPENLEKELFWVLNNQDSANKMSSMFHDHVMKNYGPSRFMSEYQRLLSEAN